MTFRVIDDEAIRTRAVAMMRSAERGWALNEFVRWVRQQPEAPEVEDGERATVPALVGRSGAASILGLQPQHIPRLVEVGRMPRAIEVEGGRNVFVRSEVEALAREFEAEHAERLVGGVSERPGRQGGS